MSVSSRAVWPSCCSNSFLLLSSTRVYARASATHEDAALPILPSDPSDLYNLTKLAGEALCLADPRRSGRAWCDCRTSMASACRRRRSWARCCARASATGNVLLREGRRSAKDYVSVAAVVRLLPAIATAGASPHLQPRRRQQHQPRRHRPLSAQGIAAGASASRPTRQRCSYPPIDTTRLDAEFGPTGSNLAADLPTLLTLAQECQCSPSTRHMAA